MLIARKSSQACTLASLHLKSGALQFHTQSSEIACALDIGASPIATAPNADRCRTARDFSLARASDKDGLADKTKPIGGLKWALGKNLHRFVTSVLSPHVSGGSDERMT